MSTSGMLPKQQSKVDSPAHVTSTPIHDESSEKACLLDLLRNLDQMASQDVSIKDGTDQENNACYLVLRRTVSQWCEDPRLTSALNPIETPPGSKISTSAASVCSSTDHTHELSDSHPEHADECSTGFVVSDGESELDEEFHMTGETRRGLRFDRKRSSGSGSSSSSLSDDEIDLLGHFEKLLMQEQYLELQEERDQRMALEQQLLIEREHRARLEQQLQLQQDQFQRQQRMLGVFHDRLVNHTGIRSRLHHEIRDLKSEDPYCDESGATVRRSVLNRIMKRSRSKEAINVINKLSSCDAWKGQEHWFV